MTMAIDRSLIGSVLRQFWITGTLVIIGPADRRIEIVRFSSIPPVPTPIIRMKMENHRN